MKSLWLRFCGKVNHGSFKERENNKDEISRSEFYYSEDLETSNVETESGIVESQEAIDDFIKKQKCALTNKQMATDLKTLLH